MEGIVLIDELDQHLHPNWQRKIIGLLNGQFPKVQFIATTHSPTCALGATDVEKHKIELAVLQNTEQGFGIVENIPAPYGKRVDQILASILFQVDSLTDDETRTFIQRYAKLSGALSPQTDNEELLELRDILDERLGSETTELEDIAQSAINYALDDLIDDASKEFSKLDSSALKYEIKRKIKEIKAAQVLKK